MPRISRRKFAQIISTAGLAGTTLLETMTAEAQDFGVISRETMQSFLDLSGMTVRDDQMTALRISLQRAVEGLRTVRQWNVPQNLDPVTAFRARR